MNEVVVRFRTVQARDLAPDGRIAPCLGCDFLASADVCRVMRARVVALGLPDCVGEVVYRVEVLR